ncbi:CIC11C00000004996 [Sungouiella intermedia]|uniref:CIC11C00000004996 n=1 Tax=Sungouiella intermedia TaxID=45354 RepID=A0A1L0C1X0_9ASCO|nr:CIC11C00000004996 [[Candida] intermedia]
MSSPEEHHHQTKKKRVGKACDLCRIKKTKCDGKKPCSRCIADNKLCAFTEKKKQKEKSHPSGYIELLETRLSLVTKSLERIVLMAEPHLPFLQTLMANARAEHALISLPESDVAESRDANYVPINEVVSYLISEMGLLDKEPLEWERGARIAAKVVPSNMDEAALDFANHKVAMELNSNRMHLTSSHMESISSNMDASGDDEATQIHPFSPEHTALHEHSRTNLSLSTESPGQFAESITEQFNLQNISLGGFSNSQLQHPQAQLYNTFTFESFPKRANLLFINNNEIASLSLLVSSLANRFESQELEENSRRRSLVTLKGTLSPSHQKMKNNGHVHKPGFQSHSQSRLGGSGNVKSNNGTEFHFPKQFPSTLSLPELVSSGLSKNLDAPLAVFDDDFLFDDLPSNYDFGEFSKGGMLDEESLFTNVFVPRGQ